MFFSLPAALRRVQDLLLRPIRADLETQGAKWKEKQLGVEAAFENLKLRLAGLDSHLEKFGPHVAGVEAQVAGLTADLARMEAETGELRRRLRILEDVIVRAHEPRLVTVTKKIKAMPSPVISVILPTRDRAHLISDAIASVKAQRFDEWELIIIDDGSRDDTTSVVNPFLADVRIRYIQQPRTGVSAARNRGLEAARGSLIAYLDSDNFWFPDFLTAAVNAFASDPTISLVYGALVTDCHQLDGTRILWMPFDRNRLLAGNYIDINVVVHRKSFYERYGGFDEDIDRLNDWDLLLRYTEHTSAQELSVIAARYRNLDDIRITDTRPSEPNVLKIMRKWYPDPSPD